MAASPSPSLPTRQVQVQVPPWVLACHMRTCRNTPTLLSMHHPTSQRHYTRRCTHTSPPRQALKHESSSSFVARNSVSRQLRADAPLLRDMLAAAAAGQLPPWPSRSAAAPAGRRGGSGGRGGSGAQPAIGEASPGEGAAAAAASAAALKAEQRRHWLLTTYSTKKQVGHRGLVNQLSIHVDSNCMKPIVRGARSSASWLRTTKKRQV